MLKYSRNSTAGCVSAEVWRSFQHVKLRYGNTIAIIIVLSQTENCITLHFL